MLPGISFLTPGYHSCCALGCFQSNTLFQRLDIGSACMNVHCRSSEGEQVKAGVKVLKV